MANLAGRQDTRPDPGGGLIAHKSREDEERQKVLAELTVEAEQLYMGY